MNPITKITTAEQLQTLLAQHDITDKLTTPFEQDFVTEDIYVRFCLGDINKPIIVAFSNAGETTTEKKLNDPNYRPWGYDFITKEGYSVISFSCYQKNNWFRTPLTQEIIKIFSQYITPYREKLGYGGSMGGYAVGAYCDLLKLDRCFLFNPISTLNTDKVPSEHKHPAASEDWHSECNDGADTVTPKYIIFDPLLARDKMHAHRYQNAELLHFRGVGHGMPKHLLTVKALKDCFYCLINNTLPDHHFYRKIRNGKRQYQHYFKFITSNHIKQLTPKRKQVIEQYRQTFISSLPEQERLAAAPKPQPPKAKAKPLNNSDINRLRDLAVQLEKTDLQASLDLMLMAQKLRPNGPFINKRIKMYREKLNTNKAQ